MTPEVPQEPATGRSQEILVFPQTLSAITDNQQ
jgi:hypothetical protein